MKYLLSAGRCISFEIYYDSPSSPSCRRVGSVAGSRSRLSKLRHIKLLQPVSCGFALQGRAWFTVFETGCKWKQREGQSARWCFFNWWNLKDRNQQLLAVFLIVNNRVIYSSWGVYSGVLHTLLRRLKYYTPARLQRSTVDYTQTQWISTGLTAPWCLAQAARRSWINGLQ